MSDWLISFSNHECPACGKGTIIPIYKKLHQHEQSSSSNTIVGYQCNSCHVTFKVKYALNEKDTTYEPHVLYLDSEIEQFKNHFISKGERSHEENNVNVRNPFQETDLQEKN